MYPHPSWSSDRSSMDTYMGLPFHAASGGESGSMLARYMLVLLPLNHNQPSKRGPPLLLPSFGVWVQLFVLFQGFGSKTNKLWFDYHDS